MTNTQARGKRLNIVSNWEGAVRYLHRPSVLGRLKLKRCLMPSFVQSVQELELSHTAGGDIERDNQLGRVQQILTKLNTFHTI